MIRSGAIQTATTASSMVNSWTLVQVLLSLPIALLLLLLLICIMSETVPSVMGQVRLDWVIATGSGVITVVSVRLVTIAGSRRLTWVGQD